MNHSIIHKYHITPSVTSISMPVGAEIISVQIQQGCIAVWAEVDPIAPIEKVQFMVIGTGHPIEPVPRKFIGTVQLHDGDLVLHVYKQLKEVSNEQR
jgi:hypothetical protein